MNHRVRPSGESVARGQSAHRAADAAQNPPRISRGGNAPQRVADAPRAGDHASQARRQTGSPDMEPVPAVAGEAFRRDALDASSQARRPRGVAEIEATFEQPDLPVTTAGPDPTTIPRLASRSRAEIGSAVATGGGGSGPGAARRRVKSRFVERADISASIDLHNLHHRLHRSRRRL
jgi:hypothetical protein